MVRGILKFNRICPTGVKFVLISIFSIFSKLVTIQHLIIIPRILVVFFVQKN